MEWGDLVLRTYCVEGSLDPGLKAPEVPPLCPGTKYELCLVNDHLVNPPDNGQALAIVIGTGSVGCPFIALHCKQPGEQLRDKDLDTWLMTKDEIEF